MYSKICAKSFQIVVLEPPQKHAPKMYGKSFQKVSPGVPKGPPNLTKILPKTLFGGHDADLGVAGGRPAKGEAGEGSVVRPSCSNPLTSFTHVDRCASPAIGELASMMILHTRRL